MPPEQNTSELDHLLVQNEKHNERQESQLDVLIQQSDKLEPILEAQLVKLGDISDALQKPSQDVPEVADTATVVVKGLKGDKGDTPTSEELLSLIKPLIPDPIKGDDGHTPTNEELAAIIKPLIPDPIPGKDGKTPTDAEIIALIEPLIPPPVPGPTGPRGPKGPKGPKGHGASFTTEELLAMLKDKLSYDDLKDLPNLPAIQALASKSTEVFNESTKIEGSLESINFAGEGVEVSSDGHGNITVVVTGGATPTVYTETPSGAIDGLNDTYAVLHTINAIYSFAIGGQFIHPADYSFTGSNITLTTPLDASLSGSPFTVTYA